MSTITYPCGCKIQYDDRDDERVLYIDFCKKHEYLSPKDMTKDSLKECAENLADQIFDELVDDDDEE